MIEQSVEVSNFDLKSYQKTLIPYAYNILGTVEDAEDIVQEVLIKWIQTDKEKIENPVAYLIKSVVNRSINEKKSQIARRKLYTGVWLPQPIDTGNDSKIDKPRILSFSFLVMMEVLNAKERAVFILKEVYDYEHSEIGNLLGITTENSRQIFKRAKNKLGARGEVSLKSNTSNGSMEKFIQAIYSADLKELELLLTEDIDFASDGGGKVTAAKNPVLGKEAVLRMILGVKRKYLSNFTASFTEVNAQPAILYYLGEELKVCQVICIKDGKIEHLYHILNPDKLTKVKGDLSNNGNNAT